jgi:serine/threonine protein kinase
VQDLVGKTVKDRYRIEQLIGRGGMAEVYKVWDETRADLLAMKVLREDLAQDKVFLRRFEREAQTLAKLQHRSIVRFYGLEQDVFGNFTIWHSETLGIQDNFISGIPDISKALISEDGRYLVTLCKNQCLDVWQCNWDALLGVREG